MTTLKATKFVHIKWVNCVLCEFAQKSCFKIKVDPELKHLLNHFPSLKGKNDPTEEVRDGRRGQSPLRRLKEDGSGCWESREPQQRCLSREERALGAGCMGKKTQNN